MNRVAKKAKKKAARVDHAEAERLLAEALATPPEQVKVHISVRLDSDLYVELNRRAKAGEADGKYQKLLNEILRVHLFPKEKRRAG